jgi:dTDP-4-dehydrorhamnose reductase
VSKILVTGANGQLGSEIQALSVSYPHYAFTFIDRSVLDMADTKAIETYFADRTFDTIINCAAYTAVDKAESEPSLADAINHQAVRTLALIAEETQTALMHISTDYVFNGQNYRPYIEKDTTDPQGIYGRTKRDGENAILSIAPKNTVIIRTSWVYSSTGANFVKTMLRLGRERDSLGVIFDQVGTPTYARDLAKAILDILPQVNNETPEIFHYSNEGVTSWYDFAQSIFELSEVTCEINPIETSQYPTPATRPHYSLLNKKKIKEHFGLSIPYWKKSLKECIDLLGVK